MLTDWSTVVHAFDSFPSPAIQFEWEGGPFRTGWLFRGHQEASYPLEPSIERAAKGKGTWVTIESMILEEFQAKARLYIDASDLPPDQKLCWLATMQHYGVPTRLLDFTYSPYLALYFAIRNRPDHLKSLPCAIWAIDAQPLLEASRRTSNEADSEEWKDRRETCQQTATDEAQVLNRNIFDPAFFSTEADLLRHEGNYWAKVLSSALTAEGIRRAWFNKKGFVALASPPIQNRRLSCQQGAFLFSGADELPFSQSLFKMMETDESRWCRLFEIPADALPEFERRLFQMNVHDLSLFPDTEGLAGLIRQKVRLHWLP